MRKTHINNFIIILTGYVLMFLIKDYIINFDIVKLNLSYVLELLITFGVYVIFLLTSLFYLTSKVFNKYIKHEKNISLVKPRIFVLIATLITTFTSFYFIIEYYYYFGSILLVYCLYFVFLYIFDNNYIRESTENKIKVDDNLVNDFLILLGGKENIINVSYEYSRLKVEVKSVKIVDLEKIKNLGAQGLFVAGNKIQAIVGNNASELENAIKKYITNVK